MVILKVESGQCKLALPAVGDTLHCAVHYGTEPVLLDVVRGVVEADVHVARPQAEGPVCVDSELFLLLGCCCPPQNGVDQLPLE